MYEKINGASRIERGFKIMEKYHSIYDDIKKSEVLKQLKKFLTLRDLSKENRKFILKSLIKSEEFKQKFNLKARGFNRLKNIIEGLNDEFNKVKLDNIRKGVEKITYKAIKESLFIDRFEECANNLLKINKLKRIYQKYDSDFRTAMRKCVDNWKDLLFILKLEELKRTICRRMIKNHEKSYVFTTIQKNFYLWKNSVFIQKKKVKKSVKEIAVSSHEKGIMKIEVFFKRIMHEHLNELLFKERELNVLRSTKRIIDIRARKENEKKEDSINLGFYFKKFKLSVGEITIPRINEFLKWMRFIHVGINKLVLIGCRPAFELLKDNHSQNVKNYYLHSLLNFKKAFCEKYLLKENFYSWRLQLDNLRKTKLFFRNLFENSVEKKICSRYLIESIRSSFLKVLQLRKNSIYKIKKLFKENLNKNKENLSNNITDKFTRIITIYDLKSVSLVTKKFILWRSKIKSQRVKESSNILINSFKKLLLRKHIRINIFLLKSINAYEKCLERAAIEKIKHISSSTRINFLLKRFIKQYSLTTSTNQLQRGLFRWKCIVEEILNFAAKKMTNCFRCNKAKNERKRLKIKETLEEILLNKDEKTKNLLKKYFDRLRFGIGIDTITSVKFVLN
jgi:hypothetical protein